MLALLNSINSTLCGFLGMSDYIQGVVVMCCINIIAVLGMSVLTGFTRLFSFGNAGFMAIGAYAAAILIVRHNLNFVVAMIIAAIISGLVAFLLGSITLKLKGDYFLITCLGFGECVRVLFNYTKNFTGGSAGFPGIPPFANMTFSVVCTIIAFFVAWRFIHSKFGRTLTSVRENEIAGEAVGINTFRVKRLSFTFSAVYAGLAGALYGGYLMYLAPSIFNLSKSCELITTTVIGGLGSLTGSVMGAILVTILPEVFRPLANYRMLIYGIAVVLIIMFKPTGLYGYKEFSIKRLVASIKSIGKGQAKKAAAKESEKEDK